MHHVINRVAMTLGLVATALAGAYSGPVAAEDKYPSRPIEFVVPWGPGGGADQLARLTGKLLEPVVGTSLPVINVPGATGGTGMAKLLSSPADGYSTPPEIIDRLSVALAKAAATPEYKKFLEEQFADPASFIDASKADAYLAEQLADMKALNGSK